MNSFSYFLVMFLASSLLHAYAQTKNLIVRSSRYFYVPTRGTIPVDDNGQPVSQGVDTAFLLFVETSENKIQWDKAWKGEKAFSVNATQMKQKKTVAGKTKPGDKEIILSAAKGNTLWQLEITGSPRKEKAPQPITQS